MWQFYRPVSKNSLLLSSQLFERFTLGALFWLNFWKHLMSSNYPIFFYLFRNLSLLYQRFGWPFLTSFCQNLSNEMLFILFDVSSERSCLISIFFYIANFTDLILVLKSKMNYGLILPHFCLLENIKPSILKSLSDLVIWFCDEI